MTPTQNNKPSSTLRDNRNNIKVLAFAKTSTLLELVASHPTTSFLYLAFNRAIKEEVESKVKARGIRNLRVATQNGFCLEHAKAAGCKCRNIRGYMSVKDTCNRLGLTGNDRYLAYPAFQIMTRFMISADSEMTMKHIPREVEDRFEMQVRRFSKNAQESKILLEIDKRKKSSLNIARRLFDSFDFSSDIMLHDVYVKLVQLHHDKISIAEEVVLLDEAQDINPVFADIASKIDARMIAVGDSNQSIYQF